MPPLSVTLYGRPGCHLCEQARALLHDIGRGLPLEVREVNIEHDDELLARYVFAIPVIAIDGTELARAPIRRGLLEQQLRMHLSPR